MGSNYRRCPPIAALYRRRTLKTSVRMTTIFAVHSQCPRGATGNKSDGLGTKVTCSSCTVRREHDLEFVADGCSNIRILRKDPEYAQVIGWLRPAPVDELAFQDELQVPVKGRLEVDEPELLGLENVRRQEGPHLSTTLIVQLPPRAQEDITLERAQSGERSLPWIVFSGVFQRYGYFVLPEHVREGTVHPQHVLEVVVGNRGLEAPGQAR